MKDRLAEPRAGRWRAWGAVASHWLESTWQEGHPVSILLLPVSWGVRVAVWLRRLAYATGALPTHRLSCPVIVVGNIVVGGTGKTPLVIWLARYFLQRGYRPGIVCRGYRGKASSWPQPVRGDSDPMSVGDEAVVLARRTGCPVSAGPDRVAAAKALLADHACNLILSDDGLQHLRLGRDIEVAVIDGVRRHGNRRLLPAGPLREPISRLDHVTLLVANGSPQTGELEMRLTPWHASSLTREGVERPLEAFRGGKVHAVCGIGNPERFFRTLTAAGLETVQHAYPDHHDFEPQHVEFEDDWPVLMTEKDAVKCQRFAADRHWYVPVRAELDPAFAKRLEEQLMLPSPGGPLFADGTYGADGTDGADGADGTDGTDGEGRTGGGRGG